VSRVIVPIGFIGSVRERVARTDNRPLGHCHHPSERAADLASAVAMVEAHQQQSDPAATYPLDQMGTAAHHVSAPGKLGTVAVRTIPPTHRNNRRHY
jgi:hypothetical protein